MYRRALLMVQRIGIDEQRQPGPYGQAAGLRVFRPKPDGEIDPAGEVGWFLQRERERRRERLHDAGRASGVHPHHLDALEAGDLTRLPPRRDTLRMLEAYALHLGFDPEPLLKHYAQFLPQQSRTTTRRMPGTARPFGSAEIIAFPLLHRLIDATKGNGGIVASICGAAFLFAAASWVLSPSSSAPGEAQALQSGPSHVKVRGAGDRGLLDHLADGRIHEGRLRPRPATRRPAPSAPICRSPTRRMRRACRSTVSPS